jgi:hypothetical protein
METVFKRCPKPQRVLMSPEMQMEQFSLAYVAAVASAGGYKTAHYSVDSRSVDLGIASDDPGRNVDEPRLDLQAKATSVAQWRGDHLNFDLKLKNYNDLRREKLHVPRILVVVVMPRAVEEWIDQSEEQLALRKCGYWLSLRGQPEISNSATVTIRIPRAQILTVASLAAMMERISNKGFL